MCGHGGSEYIVYFQDELGEAHVARKMWEVKEDGPVMFLRAVSASIPG